MEEETNKSFGDVLSDNIRLALRHADLIAKEEKSRELSLVITKLEEALHWLNVCVFMIRTDDEIKQRFGQN